MTVPVVELTDVCRTFGTDPAVYALRNVNLALMPGEWVAIVGPSGSGKSTMLNVIGLLDRHTSGTYRFDGTDVGGLDDLARTSVRGQRISVIFQAFHLLAHRSVIENVMLAELYRQGSRAGRRERAMQALARVGLEERADFTPTKLSGGQRQRVAIARAMMSRPSLLLCDEPTGNLDTETAREILDLFDQLWRDGMTIAIITHDEGVAGRAPRRVRIIDGELEEIDAAASGVKLASQLG